MLKKINILIYYILRILVTICLLLQIINNNWSNTFICILTLILFFIPFFLIKKLNIIVPPLLETTTYIFIFSAEILGEIYNFFSIVGFWDTILHTINGFICAAIGFSLINILNKKENMLTFINPIFNIIVAVSFSMTVGIFWEFIEFSIDYYLTKDMQKDQIITKISSIKLNKKATNKGKIIKNINKTIIYTVDKNIVVINGGYLEIGLIDTIKDLFVNLLGAIAFSIVGYSCLKNKSNYIYLKNFILKLNDKT